MPAPQATPPYAYVVEHRPLDACSPPACTLLSRRLEPGEVAIGPRRRIERAGHVRFGTDRNELFSRRAVVLPPGEALAFELSPTDAASAFDFYLSTAGGAGAYRARLEIADDGGSLGERELAGRSEAFTPHDTVEALGDEARFFTHVRSELPPRAGRRLRVALRNVGDGPLGVGAPLVLRRVEGRGPRQAILAFFDAVPHPLLSQLFGGSGEPRTDWVGRWVSERGLLFSNGISPGQLTGSFVRRFFKGEFYRLDGEPSLQGQGFDPEPPERVVGPIARLAEQGFVTAAIGSNLYLTPVLSRIGFDDGYNVESTIELQIHPEVVARRFDAFLAEHPDDDAVVVVWTTSTHAPWRDVRPGAPAYRVPGIPQEELDAGVLGPIWKNLLEATDSLGKIHDSALARSPRADRLWVVGTDHGHTFTTESRARPWRLPHESVENEHRHCCLATQQEARTPFVIAFEGGPPAPHGRFDAPASTFVAWRAIERRFGVALGLPDSSTFEPPPPLAGAAAAPFDDGVQVSVGNSGALSAVRGSLEYRSYEPALGLDPIWSASPSVARMLEGAASRDGDVVAEELYDLERDPGEKHTLASRRFEDLLSMRRRVADWMAEYVDTPEHPRFRYLLVLGEPAAATVDAPRPIALVADGRALERSGHHELVVRSLELSDGDDPVGVLDLGGPAASRGLVVRCGASGLPLAVLPPGGGRLNLALARTNCPLGERTSALAAVAGEAVFSAVPIAGRAGSTGGGDALPELRDALRRWGYVRDK